MENQRSKSLWRLTIAKEVIAGLGLGVLYPFGLIRTNGSARTQMRETDRTLVLVHGYMANRSCFLPLIAYLKLHGLKKIVCYEYTSRHGIEQAAIQLRIFLKKRVRGGRIDFVCHSLGGIVTQIYLQMLGGDRRTDHCITIGSPHKGTYNAYWLPSRVGHELRPESDLMLRLNKLPAKESHVKFFSILGKKDNVILPRTSAVHHDVHHVEDTGHLGLLWSPSVMNMILTKLND